MRRLIRRLLDIYWPVRRWECLACKKVWEQRIGEPGYYDRYGRLPSHRHDVYWPDVRDGWEYGGFKSCGPITYLATRVS